MKPALLYRIAAVLLLLLATGHTLGFRTPDPAWGASSVISAMQSTHFDAMGSNRTYWDFFGGFGLVASVFFVLAAVLAWQLGGLPAETRAQVRGIAWALVASFVAVTILNITYFFVIPIVCSILIVLCLTAAAWS